MSTDKLFKNNVTISGNGMQPIVFGHGYGCDQKMWRYIAPAFEKDYKVVLFDHVGSGKSDLNAYDYQKYDSLKGYAEDLLDIIVDLDLREVIFVGHSVSSIIGVLAAGERPDLFDKLVLLGPSPCYINQDGYLGGFNKDDIDELVVTLESNYLGWSSFMAPQIIGNPNMPQYSQELENSFCSMNPEIAKHFAKVTFLGDNRADLEKVATSTLILQSHPDVIAPVAVGEFVHEKIKGSQYVLLNSSGHCPHLTSPDQVISSIQSYLGS
ncbi:alpha/beta hydrolase [uncultured Cyclobacterium sp.]|uniref:alpha/beta fold hydrolase n=1 Tax=uncultured Cyclobacterium sp. TaxID=453820 RepID=UPI0030EE4331|tara:strand:+ start:170375 stop:171175 length:801 start_codon:yes stop_codon:yes gene_type:complete